MGLDHQSMLPASLVNLAGLTSLQQLVDVSPYTTPSEVEQHPYLKDIDLGPAAVAAREHDHKPFPPASFSMHHRSTLPNSSSSQSLVTRVCFEASRR
ncbi:hypothetical protein PAXRUDRAFT_482907 [Paxillus rubicundulus Ve08.2h10]|uniref:Unplaced genomic scaffold scaffold_32, whole genome shotgun sequence n=1 Tax=Paxillus rubicundulus Ve08.2h10 TaxID=930991 RepID=A0A0D0E512_9AGAM|nr:hypothetical protein PAXRUDRAFT_482907 [Paxillus rubicundulus Ve08.2h10]